MIPLTAKLESKKWGTFRRSRRWTRKQPTFSFPSNPMTMAISVRFVMIVPGASTAERTTLKLDSTDSFELSYLIHSSVMKYSWRFFCLSSRLCFGEYSTLISCSSTTFFYNGRCLLNYNPQNLSLTFGPKWKYSRKESPFWRVCVAQFTCFKLHRYISKPFYGSNLMFRVKLHFSEAANRKLATFG